MVIIVMRLKAPANQNTKTLMDWTVQMVIGINETVLLYETFVLYRAFKL
jgi:hypothetical protein